uniref:Uncharacterized protein n=1 Tax=Sphaerodactylus townsendi TaxID=933632 RepID=A0ACB8ECC8_9SAUR
MQQEIHFLRRNMELLLARTEVAEQDRQDLPQLLLLPLEGGHCGGEGHKVAVCPSKKSDPPEVSTSGAAKAGMAKCPEKKSQFKKSSGLQVEPHEVSSASEEAGGPEFSEESVGNNSDLA